MNGGTTGTLHRGRDGEFTSEHDFLLPGNIRSLRVSGQIPTSQLSQVRRPRLDENLVTVIIKSGRSAAGRNFHSFNDKGGKHLAADRERKLGREEGRMWVFIRPRGGQDCYLLTGEIRGGLELCPIHRFDGLDQIPLH